MAKGWCLLAMKKLHVSAYSGHLQVLTTFLLKEFYMILYEYYIKEFYIILYKYYIKYYIKHTYATEFALDC